MSIFGSYFVVTIAITNGVLVHKTDCDCCAVYRESSRDTRETRRSVQLLPGTAPVRPATLNTAGTMGAKASKDRLSKEDLEFLAYHTHYTGGCSMLTDIFTFLSAEIH